MRVQKFYLIVDFGYGETKLFNNLSRVALERYKEWYRGGPDVLGMLYGKAHPII